MSIPPLLPPDPFRRAFIARAFGVWVVLRLTSTSGQEIVGVSRAEALVGTTAGAIWLAAAVCVAVWYDARRRGELIFLANLGFGLPALLAVVLATSAVLEAAVRMLVG